MSYCNCGGSNKLYLFLQLSIHLLSLKSLAFVNLWVTKALPYRKILNGSNLQRELYQLKIAMGMLTSSAAVILALGRWDQKN